MESLFKLKHVWMYEYIIYVWFVWDECMSSESPGPGTPGMKEARLGLNDQTFQRFLSSQNFIHHSIIQNIF